MNTCRNCGKEIPTFKADYRYADGTTFPRKGEFAGSAWIRACDPDRNFCTMRCAARYGIRCASLRGSK